MRRQLLAVWDLELERDPGGCGRLCLDGPDRVSALGCTLPCKGDPGPGSLLHEWSQAPRTRASVDAARCPPVGPAEEEAALAPESNALAPENLPPQLLFVHSGQADMKEMHWHPQASVGAGRAAAATGGQVAGQAQGPQVDFPDVDSAAASTLPPCHLCRSTA